jgi:uncharacterized protein YktA (UPF0223 family)
MERMTTPSSSSLISTEQEDYLDQDPPIRGQRYVCLSFVSPEDVIKAKDVYFMERFLSNISADMTELWNTMRAVYKENTDLVESLNKVADKHEHMFDASKLNDAFKMFKAMNSEKLETEYLEKNDFHTTIRGLKVRGSYETQKEAEIRAQVLKRKDNVHNVFIAEVGCWCPWSPYPDEIANQEYAESSLNTLMKSYVQNQEDKDEFYLHRKDKLREGVMETNKMKKALAGLEEEDPWLKNKADGGADAIAVEEVTELELHAQ